MKAAARRPDAHRIPAAAATASTNALEAWAARGAEESLRLSGSSPAGLQLEEVSRRAVSMPAASHARPVRLISVLGRQFRNAVLLLLIGTAAAAALLGDPAEAAIIGAVLVVSVTLGAVNEFRAERAAAALADTVPATAIVIRAGVESRIDASGLVDGDVVRLTLGALVPADCRPIEVSSLECDVSSLTGESAPLPKSAAADPPGTGIAASGCLALAGSVVSAGSGLALVVATGTRTLAGSRRAQLATRLPVTAFQLGLARFSRLLLVVAAVLVAVILITGIALHRPLIQTLLFALTIAVGVTPQLLPAVVSSSLAQGARSLAKRRVLIKRLVCIEDLGNVTTLITDKTGTLTEGGISFERALDPNGRPGSDALRWARMAVVASGGSGVADNAIDQALLAAPLDRELPASTIVGGIPFDHERTMSSALIRVEGRQTLVVMGAPEAVLARCVSRPGAATAVLARELDAGGRVIAVATRAFAGATVTAGDESGLTLSGFVVFSDPVRPDATAALERLAALGVQVVIATGDHPVVAAHLAAQLGHPADTVLTGADVDALDDDALRQRLVGWAIVARVLPEQKARLVEVLRARGDTVAFLGDGVNDAMALHAADAGISVVTATDVAREAADIVLLDKNLDVVADGVQEGRRIFQNTMKYLLMGTSANFGNMLSASAASAFLPFLPMLPTQVLLNNLLSCPRRCC
jgi:Mg2+-importing ATPase